MADTPTTTPASSEEPWLEVTASRHMAGWMIEQRISLAFTTYQTGKLFLLGVRPDGQLSVFERTFSRCMGLWAEPSGQTLWVSTLYQLWRFENALRPGVQHNGHDRLYIPRVGYTTGDVDVHDIAVDSSSRVIFVNTLFGCLCALSDRDSFIPLWRPPFVSKFAAEDRCHLNGLAMEDGRPAYVTSCSQSDVVDRWREHRKDGGCVVDVRSNQIIADRLAMPHSPRVYRSKLWLHNSGTGYFGWIDIKSSKFEPIAFCPGYLRGLAFVGDYAIVGLSRPRHDKTFSGLPLDDAMASKSVEARCGLQVIDLRSGDIVQWVRLDGMVRELYDVAVLSGVGRPMALGFKTDEIQRLLTAGDAGRL